MTSSRFRGDLRRRVPYSGSTMIRLRRTTMSHGLKKNISDRMGRVSGGEFWGHGFSTNGSG